MISGFFFGFGFSSGGFSLGFGSSSRELG